MSMQAQELKTQIDLHATWLRTNGAEGVRAVLRGAVLTRADLTYAVLTDAVLRGAYLTGAVMPSADDPELALEDIRECAARQTGGAT